MNTSNQISPLCPNPQSVTAYEQNEVESEDEETKSKKETAGENKPATVERLGRTKCLSKRPDDEASKGKPQFLASREQNRQTENDQKPKLTTRVKTNSFIEIQIRFTRSVEVTALPPSFD
jgi:hypothetical protein